MAQRLKIGERIAEVIKGTGYVAKNGWNAFGKYKYVTEADLTDACRKSMAEHGVLLRLHLKEMLPSRQPGQQNILAAIFTATFFAADELEEKIEFDLVAEGGDTGDKGAYKLTTGAEKYALKTMFLIPTGDDPETGSGHGADDKREAAEPPQAQGQQQPSSAKRGPGRPPKAPEPLAPPARTEAPSPDAPHNVEIPAEVVAEPPKPAPVQASSKSSTPTPAQRAEFRALIAAAGGTEAQIIAWLKKSGGEALAGLENLDGLSLPWFEKAVAAIKSKLAKEA